MPSLIKIKAVSDGSFLRAAACTDLVGLVCIENRSMIWLNDAFARMFGYQPTDLLGHSTRILYPTCEDFASFGQTIYSGVNSQGSFKTEREFLCKDGSVKRFSFSLFPVENAPEQYAGVFLPINKPAYIEPDADTLFQRLELAVKGANLGLWDVIDVEQGTSIHDERWCSMLGYTVSEIQSHESAWRTLIHPDDIPHVEDAIHRHAIGETPYARFEHRLKHKDGHYVWTLSVGKVIGRDKYGRPERVTGVLMDISNDKKLKSFGDEILKKVENIIRGELPRFDLDSECKKPVEINTPECPVLTPRQKEIISLVAQGLTSGEIGKRLNISATTAATHRRNVMQQCGVHSSAELIRFALENRLI